MGGLIVGVAVITACGFLSTLERLPISIVVGMGVGNLLYGSYSFFVATRSPRPAVLVRILAVANMLWLPVCLETDFVSRIRFLNSE